MFLDSTQGLTKQTVWQEFNQIHRSAAVGNLWSKLTGRRYQLLRLDAIKRDIRLVSRRDAGVQTVSIDKIIGSENRSADFDMEWRPLKETRRERWMNIAVARASQVMLPALDLVKVGEHYFVRDGHHRISVAKFQGQMDIEANVIEWHCAGTASDPVLRHLSAKPAYLGMFTWESISQLPFKLSEHLNAVGANVRRGFYATLARLPLRMRRPQRATA